MKKKILIFCTVIGILLTPFCTGYKNQSISSDSVIISGKFSGLNLNKQKENSVVVKLFVSNLISEETLEYVIQSEKDGTFKMNVPLLCESYGVIISEEPSMAIALFLSPGKENEIEIFLNEENPQIKIIKGEGLTQKELQQIGILNQSLLEIILDGHNSPHLELNLSPYVYKDSMMVKMENDLLIVKNNPEISEKLKQIMYSDLKFFYLYYDLLNYEKNMRLLYMNQKDKELTKENFTPQQPDREYYSFLKDFDLNQPPYYNYMYYSMSLQSILSNRMLNVPFINDIPIDEWQKKVKTQLADLTDLQEGIFYDLLTAKAYYLQIKDEQKPLSDKQKENIQTYFNRSYIDFLFAENEKIEKKSEVEENSSLLIKETPKVSREKLMDAIISKYKGKPVLVDFWATWCGPCLQGISEMKSYKEEMKTKNMILVYITDSSSPRGLWEKKIKEIDGEHYYLSQNEWEQIAKQFDFDAIPTYLFYDSNGMLKNKITGYPSNNKMREMIEELLP